MVHLDPPLMVDNRCLTWPEISFLSEVVIEDWENGYNLLIIFSCRLIEVVIPYRHPERAILID